MPNEAPQPGNQDNANILSPVQNDLISVLKTSFKQLPKLYSGDYHQRFESSFPFAIPPLKQQLIRALSRQPEPQNPIPVELDPLANIPQHTNSDCVGAVFMSVLNAATSIPVSPNLYEEFLNIALKSGFAKKEDTGIRVSPYILNALMAPDFKGKFHSEVTVAYKKYLSPSQLSEIARVTKEKKSPAYKLFVLLPVSSVNIKGSGHFVALQKVQPAEVTVNDPKEGQKTLTEAEFNQRWAFNDKSAIFVFVKDLSGKT